MVSPHLSGVARWVLVLAKGLRQLEKSQGLKYEPVFLINPKLFLGDHFCGFRIIPMRAPFLNPLEIIEIPLILKKLSADLYHSTSFSSLIKAPCPWVVTAHDLNHRIFGNTLKKIYYQILLKRFLKKARVITTVSEFSRAEISEWLSLPQEKMINLSQALDPEMMEPASQKQVATLLSQCGIKSKGFFFCLSNGKFHKNVDLLVRAFQKWGGKTPLVLSFQKPKYAGLQNIKELPDLSDIEVKILLSQAKALFFPSLYEGFGLPPLEAAALGTPVVVSQIPPHVESLKDLKKDEVLFLNPNVEDAWVQGFQKVENNELKAPPLERREELLKRYSLQVFALKVNQVYES